jgi:hypothetical protein
MSDNFYQYADYPSLPDDQKVLWWFDEYLCHDLLLAEQLTIPSLEVTPTLQNFYLLIERHTIYDHAWADGYSAALFNLLSSTNILDPPYPIFEIIGYRANLPPIKVTGIPDGGKVIISFLYPTTRKTLLSRFLPRSASGLPPLSFPEINCVKKHFVFLTDKDNDRIINVPIALYSLVVTGTATVEAPDNYFYSNISQLTTGYQSPLSVSVRDKNDVLRSLSYSSRIVLELITAKPPRTLFNGLFSKRPISTNLSYGVSLPMGDLLYIPYAFYLTIVQFEILDGLNGVLALDIQEVIAVVKNGPVPGILDEMLQPYTFEEAQEYLLLLLAQTALINPSNSNLREIVRVNGNGEPIDYDGNVTTNPDEYVYDINEDYIEEYVMGSELMIQEIHACLGAGEFAYYLDGGQPQPYKMNMARLLQTFARAYGVAFKPDGSILPVRPRKNVPYTNGTATIPDGWTRGQFADNMGGGTTGQTGGATGEERTGIAYQNRCNIYDNLDDDNVGNDVLLNGDIVLCENFLQLFESYLDDLDKGLNWQEMGGGLVPNADGTSYTTFEGMGTLLAEVAYTLSALSSSIQQTHVLALKNNAIIMEVLKGLGLPTGVGSLSIDVGDNDALGSNTASIIFPQLHDNTVSLHKRMMDIIATLSILLGSTLKAEDNTPPTPTP